uniref:Uncharacterized protein n=1 Tax=Rhipicephalus appendiculatus TaxID=34631 RepID=A0A131YCT6_RHIAP
MLGTYFPEELTFSANTQHSTAKDNDWCQTGRSPAYLTSAKRVVIFFVEASSNSQRREWTKHAFLLLLDKLDFSYYSLHCPNEPMGPANTTFCCLLEQLEQ